MEFLYKFTHTNDIGNKAVSDPLMDCPYHMMTKAYRHLGNFGFSIFRIFKGVLGLKTAKNG